MFQVFQTLKLKLPHFIIAAFSSLFLAYLYIALLFSDFSSGRVVFSLLYLWILFSILIYFGLSRFSFKNLRQAGYSQKGIWVGLVATLLFGIYLVYAIPVSNLSSQLNPHLVKPVLQPLLNIVYLIAIGWLIGILLFLIGSWIITRKGVNLSANEVPPYRWIVYGLPLVLVWSVYLVVFWPGFMSPDSIDQWNQVQNNSISGDHRFYFTLLVWLVTRVWNSPAAMSLFQAVSMGVVVGYCFMLMEQFGVRKSILWTGILLIAISPAVAPMSITLWSDVSYGSIVLLFSFLVFKTVASDGASLRKTSFVIAFLVLALLVSLLRSNGLVASVGTLLLVWLVFRKKAFRSLNWLVAIYLVTILFCKLFLFQLLGMPVSSSMDALLFPVAHQISSFLNADVPVAPSEQALLSQIRPETKWPYDCYDGTNWAWDGKFNFVAAKQNFQELLRLDEKWIFAHPDVLIRHQVCVGSLVWRITKPNSRFYIAGCCIDTEQEVYFTYDSSDGQYKSHTSNYPDLVKRLGEWVNSVWMQSTSYMWLFWSSAFWLYLMLFTAIVLCLRVKDVRHLLFLLPALLNSFTIFLLAGGQEYRYQFCVILTGMCFWPLLFARKTSPTAVNR